MSVETDMGRRLRAYAEDLRQGIDEPDIWEIRRLMEQAAQEVDRYYNGMMNWKRTAEAKDAAPRLDKESKL